MTIRVLARAALAAGVALSVAGAAGADVFMKAANVPGDALQRGFEEQVALTGASLSISSYYNPEPEGLGETSRTTNVGPIMLTKSPDRASPKLMAMAVNGAPIGSLEISFTAPAKPGQPQNVEARWILEGAEVRSFSVYPGANPGDKPVETIEIAYASMRYQHFDKGKNGAASMEEVQWDVPADQLFPGDGGC